MRRNEVLSHDWDNKSIHDRYAQNVENFSSEQYYCRQRLGLVVEDCSMNSNAGMLPAVLMLRRQGH